MPADSANSRGPESESRGRRRPGRAPVSCLECRRLKLKCDRQVPCETCRRRGCAALCPNGTMQAGRSRTMAIVNAAEMQEKIDTLTARILELESGQGTASDNTHSLLSNDGSPGPSSLPRSTVPKDDEGILDEFGTLSLGSPGDARYFGNTARSEYLVHAPRRPKQHSQQVFPRLSKEIINASLFFDLETPELEEDIRVKLVELLPQPSDATRLCEIYLEHGKYIWDGISRDELLGEVMVCVYGNQWESDPAKCSHGLSLLFIVFALATLFDPNCPPCSTEAEQYYLLSRAALRIASPLYYTTLWSIHSLLQMSYYLELSDCESSHQRSSQAWMNIGLVVRLGHSVGLHVNNAHWKLDLDASRKRSHLFWQIFVRDTWMSFSFGRPPGTNSAYTGCELLDDEPVEEYQPWLIRYTRLLHNIMTTAFGAVRPTYQVVLHLDRKIRDFPLTAKMRLSCGQMGETNERYLYRWFGVSAKEAILVRLHRPYFAQALTDHPTDLLKHKFAPSVVSMYRSAWRLIEGVLATFRQAPQIMARVRLCWSHVLAAAIVMCLIVTRAPSSNLAGPALEELDKLCVGLQDVSTTHKVLENNLDVVKKLRHQGHEAMKNRDPGASTLQELDRISGKSQVVVTDSLSEFASSLSQRLQPSPTPAVDSRPSPTPPETTTEIWNFENLHPSIMDNWKMLEAFPANSPVSHDSLFDDLSHASTAPFDTHMIYAHDVSVPVCDSLSRFTDIGIQQLHGETASGGGYELGAHVVGNGLNGNIANTIASAGPLALDPSWQKFVEQLGF